MVSDDDDRRDDPLSLDFDPDRTISDSVSVEMRKAGEMGLHLS